MNIDIPINIDDDIYCYYPKDDSDMVKTLSHVVITGNTDSEIYLMDYNDDIICTKENIIKTIPDELNGFYFLTLEDKIKFIYGSSN